MIFANNFDKTARSVLLDYLAWATHVDFAVAFIRISGVNLIIKKLDMIVQKGGKVRVLAGQDFGYTEPDALSALVKIGAEVKIFEGEQIFHPKCYIFQNSNHSAVLIGSSNLTASGIENGTEWNIAIEDNSELTSSISANFERVWTSSDSKEISDDLLSQLEQKHIQIQKSPQQNIAQRFDEVAQEIRFQFTINRSFLYQTNHPITIPKQFNGFLKNIITEPNENANVYFKNEKLVGYFYNGFAGYGEYYQLRFQGRRFFEIENNFELNQQLNIEVKFYKNVVHVYLLN